MKTKTQATPVGLADPAELLARMVALRSQVDAEGRVLFQRWQPKIERRLFLLSALNLAHYIVLRRHDMRSLQTALMPWGLSSLGRIEGRVMPNLDAVIASLGMLCRCDAATLPKHPPLRAFFRGERLLQRKANDLFGSPSQHRRVRIMVTLDVTAAANPDFVYDLMVRGMNCARINCAHDDAVVWKAMIDNIRAAEARLKRKCAIFMDLAGPKVRTGAVIVPTDKARLHAGDRLLLTADAPTPNPEFVFQASCTLPAAFINLKPGQNVWFDDGHLGCVVEGLRQEGAVLRVFATQPKGHRLKVDKGINFPNMDIPCSPLTPKDLQDLTFVIGHADGVAYSFVQRAADIALLQKEICARDGRREHPLAIIAKIETPTAVRNLPELIIQAAGRQPLGIMIARGDLAVELGFERLAEMQEEILWLCEAAHIPVIWATQVLESVAKHGIPSRGEITDAAMAERAECVMLNKGPFVAEAVTILDDVLTRMQAHQHKKTSQLRALRSW